MVNTVIIQPIEHGQHRYPTTGDYFETCKHNWMIHVTRMKDWRHTVLVAVHELMEMVATNAAGVSEEAITAWDKKHQHLDREPGDIKGSPYGRQHRFAENIERQLAHEIGVDWRDYEKALEALWRKLKKRTNTTARRVGKK